MISRQESLKRIISEFEDWYLKDPHSKNKGYYSKTITKEHLSSLGTKAFIDFFCQFVEDGGKVQSGGPRKKSMFINTISNQFEEFRAFILRPFEEDFDLSNWFDQIKIFNGFGVGISTIFLNRLNNDVFPIFNNKTIDGLNKLGYKISSSKNLRNYQLVKEYQNQLIAQNPILNNFYKVDAFIHFIVAIYLGKELVSELMEIENFENEIEQKEIQIREGRAEEILNKNYLYDKIKDIENVKSEIVIVKGKAYKRQNYLMVYIKKYRDHKCQFCSTQILKENGQYYIEACHIEPKAKGGSDTLDNILILCPNCHKLLDYAKKENLKKENDSFFVTLNGKKYETTLR